jgi:N4-(beta-N-acetylglucosaminyl)-L-asparaginase
MKRNDFMRYTAQLGFVGVLLKDFRWAKEAPKSEMPLIVSTWHTGIKANKAAWDDLAKGGTAIDAVETAAKVEEADPNNQSVGLGGRPDRDGHVTLDACIMDHKGQAGSVAFLEGIVHPISVARRVMEKTPHVILAGEGAKQFALAEGFVETDLLTEKSKKEWKEWLKTAQYQPVINVESHDTIGILALDTQGHLAGACTTSGLAYKMHGRVGDSPIIGAGLFVDGEVGACTCSGLGELVLKTLGSFLVVEFMRQGKSPTQACKKAIERIVAKIPNYREAQVGFVAIDKHGRHGAYAIQPGFEYALKTANQEIIIKSKSYL